MKTIFVRAWPFDHTAKRQLMDIFKTANDALWGLDDVEVLEYALVRKVRVKRGAAVIEEIIES
jgi:hypothetical protein